MNKEPGSFLDSKTILGIVIVAVFWMGWQYYLNQKYPNQHQSKQLNQVQTSDLNNENSDEKRSDSSFLKDSKDISEDKNFQKSEMDEDCYVGEDGKQKGNCPQEVKGSESLKTLKFDGEKFSFLLSNHGMGISEVHLKGYTDRNDEEIILGKDKAYQIGQFFYNEKKILFDLVELEPTKFQGVATIGSVRINRLVEVEVENYVIKQSMQFENLHPHFEGFVLSLGDEVQEPVESSLIAPSFEIQDYYLIAQGKKERFEVVKGEKNTTKFQGVSLFSLGTKYFTTAIIDDSPIRPDVEIQYEGNETTQGFLDYNLKGNTLSSLDFNHTIYVGPKRLELLERVDPALTASINFGYFAIVALPILKLMKWFYSLVNNYGLAIIFLTLVVRTLLIPLAVMSHKAMKKMQVIQPLLKEVREKHKGDPQKLNQETMALMKEHKANPLGGCWPMLLQLPVFFALFKVTSISVELYKEPFFLWISDLSLKDPYYVLPVLMGVTMFFQQKLTPTAMDPAQAKVMMFMPIVFSLLMVGLPSGVNLYIFVNSLFAIIQQVILMRETKRDI